MQFLQDSFLQEKSIEAEFSLQTRATRLLFKIDNFLIAFICEISNQIFGKWFSSGFISSRIKGCLLTFERMVGGEGRKGHVSSS